MKTRRLGWWMPWVLMVWVARALAMPDASTWTEPRVFHEPFDGAFAERVTVTAGKPETRTKEAVMSANKAYWFRLTVSDGQEPALTVSAGAVVWRVSFKEAYPNFPVEARWVNEKLLFFRVYWGRVAGSDYLFDAEVGKVIHREMVHDGTLLFQQTQEAKDQASRRTAGTEPRQERTMLLPRHPRCVDLARVANRFVALGEEGMIRELTAFADAHRRPHGVESNVSEQIGWVCRLMYAPRKDATLRPPGFGGLMLPFNTLRPADWPAYPLAESGGIFFVLAQSYMLAGVPEDPVDYLAYCRKAGSFRQAPLHVPTRVEAQAALDALLGRELWKQIRWRDAGVGFSYEMQESSVVDFLKKQTFPSEADEDVAGLRLTRDLARVQDYRAVNDGSAATIQVLGQAAPSRSADVTEVSLSAAFEAANASTKTASVQPVYAERIATLPDIVSQVGKYAHPTSPFFTSPCLLTELRRILGDDYPAYREHLTVSGAGQLERAGDWVAGDVSQLHVGGYGSLFFVDVKTGKLYLFWLKETVLMRNYRLYGDRPIPPAVLSLIEKDMNEGWGHVASFKFTGELLVIREKR